MPMKMTLAVSSRADRIGQACLLNGQAKIWKTWTTRKNSTYVAHLRTNPAVVFIPAEMNGQKDDQAENLPDEETQDSQANESQEGVHAVLSAKRVGMPYSLKCTATRAGSRDDTAA